MIGLAISCLVAHLLITKMGMIFVEIEILRQGNEELLNGLDEGVVIQHEDTQEIIFLNSAAKKLQTSKW